MGKQQAGLILAGVAVVALTLIGYQRQKTELQIDEPVSQSSQVSLITLASPQPVIKPAAIQPVTEAISESVKVEQAQTAEVHEHDISPVAGRDIEFSDLPADMQEFIRERTATPTLAENVEPGQPVMVELGNRFQHVPVAVKQPDGSVIIKEY